MMMTQKEQNGGNSNLLARWGLDEQKEIGTENGYQRRRTG